MLDGFLLDEVVHLVELELGFVDEVHFVEIELLSFGAPLFKTVVVGQSNSVPVLR
jgi:hypothetical protein